MVIIIGCMFIVICILAGVVIGKSICNKAFLNRQNFMSRINRY